ncbi:hypothetical protein GJ496_003314 [Pomphorhynchus laevis]|nr:hypothetical protein GJ496_003314 [Pomphorhynchus laevis]
MQNTTYTDDKIKRFKILIVGESAVGKSSMMLKYVDNIFTGIYISTIGVDFKSKSIEIGDYLCKIQIWDTAGQERFRVITSTYYRGADAIILMYDITNRDSFDRISSWVCEIQRHCVDKSPTMVLAGNKSDFNCTAREVSTLEGEQLAKSMMIPFFETSAKDGRFVNEVFYCVTELSLQKHLEDLKSNKRSKIGNSSSKLFFEPLTHFASKVRESSFKLNHPTGKNNNCCNNN